MGSEEEPPATGAAQKYRSSPIQVEGFCNSMRGSTIETPKAAATNEIIAEGAITQQEKYRSCPIKVEGLRNSLRTSIVSKRGSMTRSELQFVQDMLLEESLAEDELESMDMVLKCDQTFFHHSETATTNTPSKEENNALDDMPSVSKSPYKYTAQECLELGSKKRQVYLEARKRQSEEQSKNRLKTQASFASRSAILETQDQATKQQYVGKIDEEEHQKDEETEEAPSKQPVNPRKVFLRQASMNAYGGEGFEIGEEAFGSEEWKKEGSETDEEEVMAKIDESGLADTPRSFSSLSTRGEGFRRASLNIYGGSGIEVAEEDLFEQVYDGEDRKSYEDYDPWLFQETDKDGKRREFVILGTSHDDTECHPHVLSPVQMDRFQPFLPDVKKGESFWLKYSLVRDGASTISFLKQVRASPYTLLAMETVDGEVFGGFFASAWTVQPAYFGTGESFLWKMKHPRKFPGSENDASEGSLVEQIERESDLEIFPSEVYYGNNYFQMCSTDKITCGGGTTSLPKDFGSDRGGTYEPHQIGFGLQLGDSGSLLDGSSTASLTFRNPPLSKMHSDGSTFELVNLEAWGFTPCHTEEEARILEYKNMFFKRHASGSFHG